MPQLSTLANHTSQSHIHNEYLQLCFIVLFPSVLWRCWLGDRKDIWTAKKLLVVTIWLELYRPYSSSCHHHLHHPCFNKIQNGGILVPAYSGFPGKLPSNQCRVIVVIWQYYVICSLLMHTLLPQTGKYSQTEVTEQRSKILFSRETFITPHKDI